MCSFSPPCTLFTAPLGVPALAEVPPQGAIFCGSPLGSSCSQDAGSSSLKCALACGAITVALMETNSKLQNFFMDNDLHLKVARCTAHTGKAAGRLIQHPAALQIIRAGPTSASLGSLGLGLNVTDDLRNQLAGDIGQAHIAPVKV